MGMFKTFVQRCRDGEMRVQDIDDFVEEWHTSEQTRNMTLHECIGLTQEEYASGIFDLEPVIRKKLEETV